MPRKPRVHFPGAVYHVVARGNNQEKIFASDKDKQYYLHKIGEYRKRFGFTLLIYVVMDNHAHMVLQVGKDPLSQIMRLLQHSYAVFFNRKYERCGHVFENRFKAFLCDDDRYLLALIRYIHRNPLEAGLSTALDYKWSSHGYYAGTKKGDLVDTAPIYGLLNRFSPGNPAVIYQQIMQAAANQAELKKIALFVEGTAEKAKSDHRVEELIERIAVAYAIDKGSMWQKSRSGPAAAAKKELVRRLDAELGWSHIKIATYLRVSPSYIGRILKLQGSSE